MQLQSSNVFLDVFFLIVVSLCCSTMRSPMIDSRMKDTIVFKMGDGVVSWDEVFYCYFRKTSVMFNFDATNDMVNWC